MNTTCVRKLLDGVVDDLNAISVVYGRRCCRASAFLIFGATVMSATAAAPVAYDDLIAAKADTQLTLDYLLLNDTDADGSVLNITATTSPAHGTLTALGGNSYRYTPTAGYVGRDSFTYTVSDGTGGTDTAVVNLSVNAAYDVNAARDTILAGVTQLTDTAYAGVMSVWGPTAASISNFRGEDETCPIIAAATMGAGRVVALPHDQWLNMNSLAGQYTTGVFYKNAIAWIANTTSKEIPILTMNSSVSTWLTTQGYTNVTTTNASGLAAALPGKAVFIPGSMGSEPSVANITAVKNYIQAGGGFFACEKPQRYAKSWQAPLGNILREAGVSFINENDYDPAYTINRASNVVTMDTITTVFQNPSIYTDAQKVRAATVLGQVVQSLPDDDIEKARCLALMRSQYSGITPTPQSPVTDAFQRKILDLENREINMLPLSQMTAHRAALPVSAAAPRVSGATFGLEAPPAVHYTKTIYTPYYAAPGEMVTIQFPAALIGLNLDVRVSHLRSASASASSYPVMPKQMLNYDVTSTSLQVASPHGGLIQIIVPGDVTWSGTQNITVTGAVQAPYFKLGTTTDAQWVAGIRDRGTPFGVLESPEATLVVAADTWLRTLADPEAVITEWNYFCGKLREFYVYNPGRQLPVHHDYYSAGGVSTYPQSYDVTSDITNSLNLRACGYGLTLHEYGHICDSSNIGFNGFSETSPNMGGKWIQGTERKYSWKQALPVSRINNYLYAQADANLWTYGPHHAVHVKITPFDILSAEFGPGMIQQCVAAMSAMSGLTNDQAKRDEWVRQVSNRTGYNMSAFFAKWLLNVSASVQTELSSKPDWLPIERVPESLTVIQNTPVTFVDPSSNDFSYDGALTLTGVSQPGSGTISNNGNGTYTYTPAAGFTGSTSFTYTVTNATGNAFTTTVPVKVVSAANDPKLAAFDGVAKGGAWTTITLPKSYNSMVVVAQPAVGIGAPPMVARIRNASGSSFQVRLDRLDGSATPVDVTSVRFLIVEEGVYNVATHGIKMEAVKFTSSSTDRGGVFTGTNRSYAYTGYDHYFIPTVFGQVMTTNDDRWSAFWYKTNPNHVQLGKHVGEDVVTTRANETIGYIVMEAGSYQFGNDQIQVGKSDLDAYAGFGDISEAGASYDFVGFPTLHSAQVSADVQTANSSVDGYVAMQTVAVGNRLSAYLEEDSIGDIESATGKKSFAYLLVHHTNGGSFAKADQIVALSGKTTLIKALANDDILGSSTIQVTQQPTNGVVTVHPDGSLIYTSNAGFTGSDAFVYTVTNAQGSSSSVVNLQVEAVAASQAGIKADRFNGISGNSVSNLTGSPNFPSSPSTSTIWTTVNSGEKVGDNLGHRIYGYIVPPTTGDYTFWIASDDNSQLFLSTDFSATSKRQIASVGGNTGYQNWDQTGSQKSAAVTLEAGRAYYLEVLHKEGGGGDHVSVAWQGPGIARTLLGNPYTFTLGNTAPTLASAPSNVSMNEGVPTPVNLAGIFASADAGDPVTVEVHGNTRSDLVSTSIVGNTLTVSQAGYETGSAVITLRGFDRTGTLLTTSFTVTVNDSVADSDGDDLTDSWEVLHFGNLAAQSANGDPDGDGFTNALEEVLGTDPDNSSSKPDTVYSGLQAWWKLDESSGTVADDTTGRPQDGALVGSPAWVSGLAGNAVTFNGTNQSVQVPTISLNSNTVTISAWVKRNGTQVSWAGLVFDRGNSASGLDIGANNQLRYHWNNASNTYSFISGLTVPDNTWTFCSLVVEATKATFYMQPVGGAMQSAINNVTHAAHNFSANMYLGQDSQGGRFFKGVLDDVKIFSRALSETEIGQLANQYALPLPWANASVGTGALVGGAQCANGKYTVSGSGALGATADQAQYAYQTLTGDGTIVARISNLHDTGTSASVGVMVRDSLATGAAHVFVGTDGAGIYKWALRTTTDGTATVSNGSVGIPGSQWVKIVRSGNTFTVSTSADGSSWSVLGSASVTMASNCYIGLSSSSGSLTTINTSQFTNVNVTP